MKHTEIFAREDVEDALDEGETIERLPWRHGTRNTIHFVHLGKDWITTIDVHSEEGWLLTNSITAIEVKKVIKSIEVWEPVESKEHETK